MLKQMNFLLLVAMITLFGFTGILVAQDNDEVMDDEMMDNGLMTIVSQHSVTDTMDTLVMVLEEKNFVILARVDHQANAASVDMELRPTQLLIFGNPMAGTPLMQNSQSVAIDLPQKYLVWEDADGAVYITWNNPNYLAWRHGIEDMDEALGNVSNALNNFATQAAGEMDDQ